MGAWADASLGFAYEWDRYFRGELPVKDDTDVTEDDVRNKPILFGDPGSNVWIRQVLPKLPVAWSRKKCASAERSLRQTTPRCSSEPARCRARATATSSSTAATRSTKRNSRR